MRSTQDVKRYLELLSKTFIDAWDVETKGKIDFLRKYGGTEFAMLYEPDIEFPFPRTTTMEGHIDFCKSLKTANPAWNMGAYNFSAVLDSELENATVWFT